MGELHNNPLEWRPLIAEQLIDFIRAHISQLGGLNAGPQAGRAVRVVRRSAPPGTARAMCRPSATPPTCTSTWPATTLAFRKWSTLSARRSDEVFPGCPELRGGYLWANDKPGWGMDLDEAKAAAQYPIAILTPIEWTQSRWPDGTVWTP